MVVLKIEPKIKPAETPLHEYQVWNKNKVNLELFQSDDFH